MDASMTGRYLEEAEFHIPPVRHSAFALEPASRRDLFLSAPSLNGIPMNRNH
jgi:hypothetical protein